MTEVVPDTTSKITDPLVDTSSSLNVLPVINLDLFIESAKYDEPELIQESTKVAECLHKYGILVVKDPVRYLNTLKLIIIAMSFTFENYGFVFHNHDHYHSGRKTFSLR